jgi:putative addiction module component (TIGR02574 family)
MTKREEILQQALALSPGDREYVVTALEESLAANDAELPDVALAARTSSAEFLAELRRRSAAHRAGSTTSRPADEVLADLTNRQIGGMKP